MHATESRPGGSREILEASLTYFAGSGERVSSSPTTDGASSHSWNPNQAGMIRSPAIHGEIPVVRVAEAGRVTIEKSEMRAARVEIGVDETPRADGGKVLR